MLNRCGIKAVVANNGQEAVDMIEAGEKFSLILMDVQMPVMVRERQAKRAAAAHKALT